MRNMQISCAGVTGVWSFRSVTETDHYIVFVKVRATLFGRHSCKGGVIL
jgi:hypothetical protein